MTRHLKTKIICALVVAIALLCAPIHVAAVTQTMEVTVGSSVNDAEESSLGVVNLTDTELDLGGLYRKVGLRFTNVGLARNTVITRAYIEFTTSSTDTTSTTFKIEAVSLDNPGAFTTESFNIHTRPVYDKSVDWPVNYPWATVGEAHQSADITVLVQMLVNRSGWAAGNAMAFVISNSEDVFRRACSWDGNAAKTAKLHIEYAINMVEVRVAASTDDVYQYLTNAVYNGADAVLSYGSFYYSGFRFLNVNIPQGAVINSAYLKFVSKADYPATTGYMRLMGENRLNPPTFSLTPSNADSVFKRYMTSSLRGPYVQWANTAALAQNQEYVSADIKSIIQPIVGQAGWDTSDKSLALWFYVSSGAVGSQQRKVWTYDGGDPSKAPLLHIEYGQNPPGVGTDPPVISLSSAELGRSAFEGTTPANQYFSLMNSGVTALNYTRTVTYNKGFGWLSLSPAAAGGSLGAGENQNFTAAFNTTGLTAGTYTATISFADPNAVSSPQEVKVSLTVLPQSSIQCGEIPLYTQNIASPAVMILLDLSSSMAWEMDLIPDSYDFSDSTTPDVRSVVQEIVNRDGWVAGNALTFIIEHVSGSGYRVPRMFEGYSPSAALLHLEYDDGSEVKVFETPVKLGTDDGAGISGGFATNWVASANYMAIDGSGRGMVFRFQNLPVPKGAAVTKAWVRFVPYQTHSDPITVKISGHASDNSPTFPSMGGDMMTTSRPRTAANVTWAVPAWTAITIEKKVDVAKTVIGELVKDTGISWGFGSWANAPDSGYVSTADYTKLHVGCLANSADHQAKLQAALAGLGTYTDTPFSPSLLAGQKYFAKQRADADGILYQDASCQPKFLIEVTDGIGNVDSTKENVIARTNLLADQGVSAVGIGFGVPEGEDEQLYAMADTANTRGKAATGDSLYAMHMQDATGKAQPYLALNKDGLVDAFRTIMNNVKGAVFYGSAPAATTSTDLGDMVVLASFNAANWTGDVSAITKDENGNWNAPLWKASDHFPVSRSVWTVDSGNNLVAYTNSTLAGDNYLCKNLGDIIHSTPVVVGAPPYFYAFDSYASFKRNLSVASPREKMAYVGSNDGLLHAFSLETGQERWAFLPKSLQAKLNEAGNGASYDPCSTSYCHRYLLDGSPQVADVYGSFGGANKWLTLLVVGLGGGGTAYTALDVTKGESFGAGADQAKFLWELTDADLGESWSDAAIERVSYPAGGAGAAAWGVFVGSGYDANDNLQPNKEAYLYGVEAATGNGLWSNGNGTSNKVPLSPGGRNGLLNWSHPGGPGSTVYNTWFAAGETVRGMNTGASATVYRVPNNVGSNVGTLELVGETGTFMHGEPLVGASGHNTFVQGFFVPSQIYDDSGHLVPEGVAQKNNAMSSPVTGNFNAQDGIEDCIYLGDLYGTMFRVDSIGKGQSPAVSRLFKFDPYPTGPGEHPIRGKASVAYNEGGSGLWVYYGTGRYETAADKVNSQQQYFFGLKDAATPRGTPYSLADLTTLEARFTTATIGGKTLRLRTISGSNASANPWAMKLFAGQGGWGGPASVGGSERVFTKPLVVGGIVFFTTFIPDADVCTGSGDTYVFALDYKTGLPPTTPVFDLNGDNKFSDADKADINGAKVVPIGVYVGRGQGSAPVLFKDTLFVTTSTPQYQSSGVPGSGSGNVTGLNSLLVNIPQKRIRVESWKHN